MTAGIKAQLSRLWKSQFARCGFHSLLAPQIIRAPMLISMRDLFSLTGDVYLNMSQSTRSQMGMSRSECHSGCHAANIRNVFSGDSSWNSQMCKHVQADTCNLKRLEALTPCAAVPTTSCCPSHLALDASRLPPHQLRHTNRARAQARPCRTIDINLLIGSVSKIQQKPIHVHNVRNDRSMRLQLLLRLRTGQS